ncbi:hypothetical protein, partial [Bradyrhizobium sp.]|uniref:hypothetical protein n=1 Tax=Bradyrhizobium sp. TaxID=376 RepID=UPI003C75A8CB
YQGKAKNAAAVEKILAVARSAASDRGWGVREANVASASVSRGVAGKESKEKEYQGPPSGIVIYPHPMCEPVHIQFGTDLLMRDFVKTQFAGADVHVEVVGLLRKLRPLLADLQVVDEGEYWETGDRARLAAQIATVNAMIESIRKSRPGVKGTHQDRQWPHRRLDELKNA